MSAQLQPSLFAADPGEQAAEDAEWLDQVRADAGRWWATYDARLGFPLVLDGAHGWRVRTRDGAVVAGQIGGGQWPDEQTARLWLWLALGAADWALWDSGTVARTWGDSIDVLAARLRRAVTGSELR